MSMQKGKNARGRARDRPIRAQRMSMGAGGTVTLEHVRRSIRASAELADSEVVLSAVSRIAGALAAMPVHLYRGNVRQSDDPRDMLLSMRPNRRQSAFEFKRACEMYRNTEGRCYIAKRYGEDYSLRELEVLNPARVTPLIDSESGDIWYQIERDDGKTEYLHNWYVMALHFISPDGVSGIRAVDVLRGSIDYNNQIKEFSLAALKAVNRGIVLEFPSSLAGVRREKAVREFMDLYRKSGGQIIALESGIKSSTLSMSPIDSSAFDVEKVTRSRVAMVYNLPPYLLGDTSAAAKATTVDQTVEFLTLTMQAVVSMWEQELCYKLLTPEERRGGYEFRIDMESYLRTSPEARAQIAQQRIRCGLRTVNEIRAAEYLEPVEGGDVAMVSKDLAPVSMVAAGATVDANAIAGEHNAAK